MVEVSAGLHTVSVIISEYYQRKCKTYHPLSKCISLPAFWFSHFKENRSDAEKQQSCQQFVMSVFERFEQQGYNLIHS